MKLNENGKTTQSIWRPTNPHDRFCRATVYHPLYAPDFLRSYGGPVLSRYIDLDHLQEAPTTHLSNELKEVIMDASLVTRLLDTHFPLGARASRPPRADETSSLPGLDAGDRWNFHRTLTKRLSTCRRVRLG